MTIIGIIAVIVGLLSILFGGFILYEFYVTLKEINYISILFITLGIAVLLVKIL